MKEIKISGLIATVPGTVTVPVFGKQNLTNLMAAATIAYVCGMAPEKIWSALAECKTSWGRNQFVGTKSGAEILFDGYNANPDSMRALLENIPLLNCRRNKIGVFGQMKELGELSNASHIELGELAGRSGFFEIYFIGEDHAAFKEGLRKSEFKNDTFIEPAFSDELGKRLGSAVGDGDIVVIKGSRGAETERFISYCDPLK